MARRARLELQRVVRICEWRPPPRQPREQRRHDGRGRRGTGGFTHERREGGGIDRLERARGVADESEQQRRRQRSGELG